MILFGDRDDVALRFVFEAKARPRIARPPPRLRIDRLTPTWAELCELEARRS